MTTGAFSLGEKRSADSALGSPERVTADAASVFGAGSNLAAELARQRIAGWLGRAQEGLLLAVLVLAPLGLGGARVWAWTVLGMLVGLAVVVWLTRMAVQGELALVRTGGIGIVGVALAALILAQIVPLPRALVSTLSPQAAALHDSARETLGLGPPGWMTLSIAPHATRVELAKWLMIGAVFVLVLNGVRTRDRARRLLAAILVGLVVLTVAAVGLWRGYETLVPRFTPGGPDGASITDRLVIMRKTPAVVAEYPVVGAGLGAFQFAHMPHADPEIATRRAVRTHNDYLQWTAELGLLGAAMLVVLAALYVVRFVKGWRHCRDRRLRLWGGACLMAALPILVHAGFDFGLQIPAVAITLVTVLALALATVRLSETAKARAGLTRRRWRPKAWWRGATVAAALIAVVLGPMVWPVRDLAAWTEIRNADVERAPAEAAAAYGRALEWTPDDPVLLHERVLATRAELEDSCREKVGLVVRLLTGGREIPAEEVPASAQEWLVPAVWADGADWLTGPLQGAVEDAGRALILCPGKAEFYLIRAHLELDRVRAGQGDEESLRLADRAAERAVALAPTQAWVALDAGKYWATRWGLAPTPEAKDNYERLLARAVRLNPGKSYEAMRAALVAEGSLGAAEAIASDHPHVQNELRKLRININPNSKGRVTVVLPQVGPPEGDM